MSAATPDDVLALHAIRLGFADTERAGARFDLPTEAVEEALLDAEALGWVRRSSFAGDSGWALTDAGQQRDEHLLAAELDQLSARPVVEQVHRRFLPANAVVTEACTQWQLAELSAGPAEVTVDQVISRLRPTADLLGELEESLAGRLRRFTGYHDRYRGALDLVRSDPAWITAMDRDSCHRVWFEFHEDLVATLGLKR